MSVGSVMGTGVARRLAAQAAFARYAAALDEHDLAALKALHDEDATWTFATAGQPVTTAGRGSARRGQGRAWPTRGR